MALRNALPDNLDTTGQRKRDAQAALQAPAGSQRQETIQAYLDKHEQEDRAYVTLILQLVKHARRAPRLAPIRECVQDLCSITSPQTTAHYLTAIKTGSLPGMSPTRSPHTLEIMDTLQELVRTHVVAEELVRARDPATRARWFYNHANWEALCDLADEPELLKAQVQAYMDGEVTLVSSMAVEVFSDLIDQEGVFPTGEHAYQTGVVFYPDPSSPIGRARYTYELA